MPTPLRRGGRWLAGGLLLGCSLAVAGGELEAKVQAAFLFNFTKFVEWPGDADAPLTLCVSGAENLGRLLAEVVSRPSKGRALKVEVGRPAEPSRCQVLYIGAESPRVGELLEGCRDAPVLTVSDLPDFVRQGGIIGFFFAGQPG